MGAGTENFGELHPKSPTQGNCRFRNKLKMSLVSDAHVTVR